MYEYRVNIVKIVDGDTVDVDIDLGFGMWIKDERVRMMGIDTPESRTRDKVEKKFGLASKAKLKSLLGKTGVLKTQVNKHGEDMKGKFGRILGHAVAYFGGSKDEVQAKHLENRERLIAEGVVSL